MKAPNPDTAFCTRITAAKNNPSDRRPVRTALSSTTSVIIEPPSVPQAMESVVAISARRRSSTFDRLNWSPGANRAMV